MLDVRQLLICTADFLEENPARWSPMVFTDESRNVACVAGWMYKIASQRDDGACANPDWIQVYTHAINYCNEIVQRDRPKKKKATDWLVGQWNDAKGRTVEHVIALCREAANMCWQGASE